jgi:hypothetical protein
VVMPRQYTTVVAVCLLSACGMMNPVHVRSNQEQSQSPF